MVFIQEPLLDPIKEVWFAFIQEGKMIRFAQTPSVLIEYFGYQSGWIFPVDVTVIGPSIEQIEEFRYEEYLEKYKPVCKYCGDPIKDFRRPNYHKTCRDKHIESLKEQERKGLRRPYLTMPEITWAIQKRDKNICQDCGMWGGIEYHHIIPFSKGGANTPDNMISLCHECHLKRHSTATHIREQHKPLDQFFTP